MSHVRIGIAGPVGSGKTALIEALVRKMAGEYSIGVVTNDIYTHEDAQFLTKNSVLPADRIVGVETGGCPHTAIREDASMNLEAVEGLKSDLLVINKIDLAPYVGASLEVMDRDSHRMRGARPFLFTNIMKGEGVDEVISWIKHDVLLEDLAEEA